MKEFVYVSITLFIIWGIFYFANRKNISSGKIYFCMLLCMLLPPSLGEEALVNSWYHEVDLINIFVFAICLCVGFIPWLVFDKRTKNKIFEIKDSAIPPLKISFTILIIWSLFSIIYLMPSAITSLAMGASETRAILYSGKGQVLPQSPFTTLAVAGASCYIYAILFFYIACLSPKLKRYRVWLIISSLSYIVNCLAFTARDGLIFIPLIYLVFYLVFKRSLHIKIMLNIKKRIKLIVILAVSFLVVFSLSRFAGSGKKTDWESVYSGTFGYITQQPYVFDATIKGQDDFWGFEVRFPLINRILGIEEHEVNRKDNSFEWSFGTMYAEHYSAFGWSSLILITLITVLFFSFGISYLFKRKKYFGAILIFNVYCYLSISGMFYTRAGANVNLNIFYLLLSLIPFFAPRYISCKNTKSITR